jgi:GNAT superfamily N-acetyltransferase
MAIAVRLATPADAPLVAEAVRRLLTELSDRDTDGAAFPAVAADLLSRPDAFAALLAFDGARCVGVLTLSSCVSVYARGDFGEIAELYVDPAWRSQGVGRLLVEAAAAHGHARGWSRLEVGAPPAEAWARTVAFYRNNGFSEIGPRLGLSLA